MVETARTLYIGLPADIGGKVIKSHQMSNTDVPRLRHETGDDLPANKSALDRANEELRTLHLEVTKLRGTVADLTRSQESQEATVNWLTCENDTLHLTIDNLTNSNKSLTSDNKSLREASKEMVSINESLRRTNKDLVSRRTDLDPLHEASPSQYRDGSEGHASDTGSRQAIEEATFDHQDSAHDSSSQISELEPKTQDAVSMDNPFLQSDYRKIPGAVILGAGAVNKKDSKEGTQTKKAARVSQRRSVQDVSNNETTAPHARSSRASEEQSPPSKKHGKPSRVDQKPARPLMDLNYYDDDELESEDDQSDSGSGSDSWDELLKRANLRRHEYDDDPAEAREIVAHMVSLRRAGLRESQIKDELENFESRASRRLPWVQTPSVAHDSQIPYDNLLTQDTYRSPVAAGGDLGSGGTRSTAAAPRRQACKDSSRKRAHITTTTAPARGLRPPYKKLGPDWHMRS